MANQSIYYFSSASCGSGKTEWAIRQMVQNRGRYVYVVDRTDEFEGRRERISGVSAEVGNWPAVRALSSKAGDVVTRDFPHTIDQLSLSPHAILIITHEAMKLVDHTVVAGHEWQIIIDEDPKIWSHAAFDLPASQAFWANTYNLETFMDGYSTIRPKADAPTWREMMADDFARPFAPLHARLDRGQTVVNIENWADLPKRKRLSFFSVWNVEELLVYDRVTFLANSFESLVTYRLITALFESIKLVGIPLIRAVSWKPRRVSINYVASNHRAGTNFFVNSPQGQKAVEAWAAWVNGRAEAVHHYWATNRSRAITLPGQRVSPKIAGSNAYRHLTQCSVLYTAKASSTESRIFAALTDGLITAEEVMRDREYEDLIQIVFRSSLRMPDDDRPVTLNVYDREQAEFLEGYFRDSCFPFEVVLDHHDIGIDFEERPVGRPTVTGKAKSNAERQRAWRERQALKRAA